MFNEKKNGEPQTPRRNLISPSTSIKGDIVSEGDFRIEGTVVGTVKTTGRLIIGIQGVVKGDVECANADIEGTFTGKMHVSDLLFLKQTAKLSGEVFIGKLSVEPGATFDATCEMTKGSVKELNKNDATKQTEKSA